MNSPLYIPNTKLKFTGYENNKMIVQTDGGMQYKVGLTGDYQLKNVATVLRTLEVLNRIGTIPIRLDDTALRSGLENVVEITGFRGRWEVLQDKPRIVADTGHNVAGIEYVVEQLKHQTYEKLHIVIGMVNDKDISHVLELLPREAEYYFTQAACHGRYPLSN